MTSKKGRPQKNNNNIIINDINVEYLSTKTDKYDNSIAYFKLTEPKSKLKPLFDTTIQNKEGIKLPLWITEEQDVIIKIKEKWLNISDDLQQLSHYILNVDFNSFSLDTDNGTMKGYYAKVIRIKKKKMDTILDINDDN